MPRTCSVCNHPEKEAINMALVENEPFRYVSKQYRVSVAALYRHKTDHLPASLTDAKEATKAAQADSLLDRLMKLNHTTMAILDEARKTKDNELALKAIQRAEKQLELQAKLLGELNEGSQVNILVTTPEWIKIRTGILLALKNFPDAQEAVLLALGEVNHAGK